MQEILYALRNELPDLSKNAHHEILGILEDTLYLFEDSFPLRIHLDRQMTLIFGLKRLSLGTGLMKNAIPKDFSNFSKEKEIILFDFSY